MVQNLETMSKWIRQEIIEMAHSAGKNGAHLGSSLSCVEILTCLYGKIMDISPSNCTLPSHDVFIPSKAHCVLSYYSALAYCGFFPKEELSTFEDNLTRLPGHPVMNPAMGIEFSGGSLGMGFSQGVGVALGMRQHDLQNRIYVLLGDGECDEGSNWEAAQAAAHYQLNHLTVIIDANQLQYDGLTQEVMNLQNLTDKFQAFGFYTAEADGHSIPDLLNAFDDIFLNAGSKPSALIAHTVKGKGVSFMEHQKQWHHSVLSDENYQKALHELDNMK